MSVKDHIGKSMTPQYKVELEQAARNWMNDEVENVGDFLNECCCQYYGYNHDKWVEEVINVFMAEIKRLR